MEGHRLVGPVVLALALIAATPATGALVQVDVPTDSTAMDVHLAESGDADWTITYRVELSSDDRRAAFADLEDDVAANESAYLDRFRTRMDRTVARAENATGREMAVENLSVATDTTGVPAEYGLLTYRFRWTNFAATDGEGLAAGDALEGLFLDEDSSLTVGWPEGYGRASVTPEPTTTGERSVTWRGPREFGPDEPRVVVEPSGSGFPLWAAGAGVVAVLAALGGAFVWRRGRRRRDSGSADAGTVPSTDETPSEDLLSNEERVLKLLEASGGRIKQQEIAARLEWTDAKTSQVIGDLREAGEVETFRIGRENVVTLPGHEL